MCTNHISINALGLNDLKAGMLNLAKKKADEYLSAVHFYQPVQGVVDLVDTGQCGQMRVQLEICEGDIKINICYSWQLCTSIWAVHEFICVCVFVQCLQSSCRSY